MQLVPANVRAMLVGQLRQGFEQAMARAGEEAAESADYAESTMQQLEMLIEDTDELFFGWNTDPTAREVVFETRFSAVPDSKIAAMYGSQTSIPSRFASVIRDDAAAYFHGAASLGPEIIEQSRDSIGGTVSMLKTTLEQQADIPSAQVEDINELIDRVTELVIDSIAEGKTDAGAILMADKPSLEFALGAFVSDGDEAAQIVKDLAEKLDGLPQAPTFKFDVATYGGVTMHLIEADVPADEDEARKVLGDTLKVHVGTADNAVYLAIGDASVPLLKNLIDAGGQDSAGERPLSQAKILMLPILQYIRSIESNTVIDAMTQTLDREGLQGEVVVTVDGIENGQESVLKVGEGVLRAVGAGVAAGQAEAQAAAGNDF